MKLFGDLKRTKTVGKELNPISDTLEKELFALDRSIEGKYDAERNKVKNEQVVEDINLVQEKVNNAVKIPEVDGMVKEWYNRTFE